MRGVLLTRGYRMAMRNPGRATHTAGHRLVPAGSLLLVSALLVPLSGCGNACPAVGWFDVLQVDFEGDRAGVERLEVCLDGDCSPHYPQEVRDPSHPAVDPYTGDSLSVQESADGWLVSWPMQTPAAVELKAYSPSGELVAEQQVELDWKRVGGSVRCGGPHEAQATITPAV